MFSRNELLFGAALLAALVLDLLYGPGVSDVTWAAIDMLLA